MRTVNVRRKNLNLFLENRSVITRSIGRQVSIYKVVWCTVQADLQHPCHFQKVQDVKPEYYPLRARFCD